MLSRKRRASSISSKHDDDTNQMDDSTPEQSPVLASSTGGLLGAGAMSARKKRKLDPIELCQTLYDSIRNLKKEDGTMLCDTFIRAPKRRQEPSYYDVVNNPIDLLKIQQKLKTEIYDDLDELAQDFELLVNNAKAFYKPDSVEHQDAVILWQYVSTNKQKLMDSYGISTDDEPKLKRGRRRLTTTADEDSLSSDVAGDWNVYEELFASLMTSVDATMSDRPLHRMFLLLPSKKIYPDYYDVIEHPIDLRLIATKIQTNAYSNLQEMERDLLQMTKNACQFNEPGSQIYKDAKTLKKLFTQKRIELEMGKSAKLLMKRPKSLSSAAIAALKEEPDSSEDEETSKKGEGPMWALFDHLYNAPGHTDAPGGIGLPLGNSLWKLPIRRFHPEYFELIKRPISMCQIHTKLNKGEYTNISDLTGDLYLMLDNAKKAFPPTHRTHKDAAKMLKMMNAKLVEVSPEQDTSEMEDEEEEEEEVEEEEDNTTLENSTTIVASTEPQPEKKKKGRPRLNPLPNTSTVNPTTSSPKTPKMTITPLLKRKVLGLHKYLLDFSLGTRKPVDLFMEKPPRKLYPDYYDIIQNPIDMNTIENYIRNDKYRDVEDVVADYRIMFANCRQYNEEGSNIYEDANVLEKALTEKLKEFPGLNEVKKPLQKLNKVGRRKNALPTADKLWQFYETMRDFQEPKGKRQLSLIFTKLPSKTEYPDYYDIIKEPMDMMRIADKLKQAMYESLDELAADFLLMLENACKYNEPDSQIYKDALVLQQLTLQLKQSLRNNGGGDTVPDVGIAVQDLLLTLFISLYNHQDEAGRCYSDSLQELPEYDDGVGQRVRGISLDVVKRRLDKGSYKRLDIFQEDVFACLERARKLSRTDSDVFQDSVELQMFFIKKRDEVCQDTLSSSALNYTLDKLLAEVELMKQQKLPQEAQDQDQEDKEDVDTAAMQGESMIFNQNVFSPGDFVYFQHNENKIPSIAYIERLWTTPENQKMMHGAVFLRPHETYHLQSRKFLEKEVFKSSVSYTMHMEKVLGKCYIMNIKDYIKQVPENIDEKDVFVCESRYNVRARSFKKFKNWPFVRINDPMKFVQRDKPIEIKRVMSVFKERIEKHKGELEELKMQEAMVEKEKPNVPCDPPVNAEPNSVYYQQYNTICSGVVKTGDFVYVATQTGKQSIAQIHQIYEQNNKSYFRGPWLLAPSEIQPPLPTQPPLGKPIYRQEVLLSTVEEISPIVAIVGRCSVLEYQQYINSRPTEFAESDVYLCESIYDELKKSLRKFGLPNNLKKFLHSPLVTQDEIYYFKMPIKPAMDIKKEDLNESLNIMEDSMDGNPPSVSSDIATISSPAPSVSSTPLSSKKSKASKKCLTGYILYSSEVRKGICTANPESSFGDISRMVGNEWKNLPASVKQSWEDRASRINEETAARRDLNDDTINCASPGPSNEPTNAVTYECLWDKCDYQFEDMVECMEHCIADNTGHIQRAAAEATESEYCCLWRNCIRVKKNMQAFPSLTRLIKHVREVHLPKSGKLIPVHERSKNFVARKIKMGHMVQHNVSSANQLIGGSLSPRGADSNAQFQQIAYPGQMYAPPPEPMFVTVPPRPQKVLHSEAYIKYIASLQGTCQQQSLQNASNLKRTLSIANPSDITRPKNLLPSQWLGKYANSNGEDVVKALCHLRNFMMNDVLQIQRNFNTF